MPAIVTTSEHFPESTAETSLNEEVRLRIKAGAIRSWIEKVADGFIIRTEWNVIGEQ